MSCTTLRLAREKTCSAVDRCVPSNSFAQCCAPRMATATRRTLIMRDSISATSSIDDILQHNYLEVRIRPVRQDPRDRPQAAPPRRLRALSHFAQRELQRAAATHALQLDGFAVLEVRVYGLMP